jgi:ribokinase
MIFKKIEMKNSPPKIAVVGSIHMDLMVKTERIPRIGETVLGNDFKF